MDERLKRKQREFCKPASLPTFVPRLISIIIIFFFRLCLLALRLCYLRLAEIKFQNYLPSCCGGRRAHFTFFLRLVIIFTPYILAFTVFTFRIRSHHFSKVFVFAV